MPPGTTSCSSIASWLSVPSVGVGSTDLLDPDVVGVAADLLAQPEQQGGGQAGHGEVVADGHRVGEPHQQALGAQGPGQRDLDGLLVDGGPVAAPGPVLVGAVVPGLDVELPAALDRPGTANRRARHR